MGKIKKQKERRKKKTSSSDARGTGDAPSLKGGTSSLDTETTGTGLSVPVLNKKEHPTKIVRKQLRMYKGLGKVAMKKKYKRTLRHQLFMTEMNSSAGNLNLMNSPKKFEELEDAPVEYEDGSKSPSIMSQLSPQNSGDLTSPLLASSNIDSVGISENNKAVKKRKAKSRKKQKSMLNAQATQLFEECLETASPSSARISGEKKRNKPRKGGIAKSKKRQKSMLQDVAAFQKILNNRNYQSDPTGSISSLVQERLLHEKST